MCKFLNRQATAGNTLFLSSMDIPLNHVYAISLMNLSFMLLNFLIIYQTFTIFEKVQIRPKTRIENGYILCFL